MRLFRIFLMESYMSPFRRVAILVAYLLTTAAQLSALEPRSCSGSTREQVRFYEDPYYGGDGLFISGPGEISDLRTRDMDWWNSWNDQISSLEVPPGYRVILYRDRFFGGPSVSVTGNVRSLYNVGGYNWDNHTSSFKVTSTGTCAGQSMAIFYDRPGYQGRSFVLYPGEALRRLRDKRRGPGGHWDNRIESVRIIGDFDVALYEDSRYLGPRVRLSQSTPDLRYVGSGWDDRASSVILTREY